MIQVKEFLNYQEGQENEVNKWLQEMGDSIKIIDIKYSIAALPPDTEYGWHTQETNGTLIIYKTKRRGF